MSLDLPRAAGRAASGGGAGEGSLELALAPLAPHALCGAEPATRKALERLILGHAGRSRIREVSAIGLAELLSACRGELAYVDLVSGVVRLAPTKPASRLPNPLNDELDADSNDEGGGRSNRGNDAALDVDDGAELVKSAAVRALLFDRAHVTQWMDERRFPADDEHAAAHSPHEGAAAHEQRDEERLLPGGPDALTFMRRQSIGWRAVIENVSLAESMGEVIGEAHGEAAALRAERSLGDRPQCATLHKTDSSTVTVLLLDTPPRARGGCSPVGAASAGGDGGETKASSVDEEPTLLSLRSHELCEFFDSTELAAIGIGPDARVALISARMSGLLGGASGCAPCAVGAPLSALPYWAEADARGFADLVERERRATARAGSEKSAASVAGARSAGSSGAGANTTVVRFRVRGAAVALTLRRSEGSISRESDMVLLLASEVDAGLASLLRPQRGGGAARSAASSDSDGAMSEIEIAVTEVSSLTEAEAAPPAPVARLKCSVCDAKYSAAREFNSLWQLEREQCPACGSFQFPTLDGVLEGGSEAESEAGSSAPRRTMENDATPRRSFSERSFGNQTLGDCSQEIAEYLP